MKLDQFVEETLLEIMRGVHRAKSAAGIAQTPSGPTPDEYYKIGTHDPKYRRIRIREVEYDIAVTVTETVRGKGKGKVNLGIIQVAAGGDSDTSETSTHRIRFRVPVTFDGAPDPPGDGEG